MPQTRVPRLIESFVEAAYAALDLRDRHACAHVAALLDDDGYVVDFHPFVGPDHSVESALHWADCMITNYPEIQRMILLSAVANEVLTLRETDLDLFRRARRAYEPEVEVVDWILTDGEHIRSLSCSIDPEPWGVALLADPEEPGAA